MADLENFFAKKDKKKTKPKKFTPEEVAKKLEEAEKKQLERDRKEELKRKQERDEQLENVDPAMKKEAAEEWHEEVEEEVDLTDLNIQQLEQTDQVGAHVPSNHNGETPANRQAAGPWNKGAASNSSSESDDDDGVTPGGADGQKAAAVSKPESAAAAVAAAAAATSSEPAAPASTASASAAATPSSGGGSYVPPGRRAAGGAALAPVRLSAMGGRAAGRLGRAPDINSDEAFPTLGAEPEDKTKGAWAQQRGGTRSFAEFQRVRHGNASSSMGSQQDARFSQNKVTLGNQFEGLRLNDAS